MMSNSLIQTRVNSREMKSREMNNREIQSKYRNNNMTWKNTELRRSRTIKQRSQTDWNQMEIKFSRIIKVNFSCKLIFRSIKLLQISFQINKTITNLFSDQQNCKLIELRCNIVGSQCIHSTQAAETSLRHSKSR